ncbi:MAG: hypothetical protein RL322_352 [Pseudomonadota bacterium]|jgi:photosystem II stability/assembly factor-like uncharacterized protein
MHNVRLYAGTAGHSTWFSSDLGDTWIHPNSHSGMYTEARVWAFSSHPADPDTLWAGSDMGLFRWSEAAAAWTTVASPMQDVWALAQDPDNARRIIAGTRPGGLFRSEDGGLNWTQGSTPGVKSFSEINRGPTRVTQILFDPIDRGTIWAGIEIGGIWRSVDQGRNWTFLDKGLVSGDVHGLAVVREPDGTKAVLATTNKGLHRSRDNGETWAHQPIDSPWQYSRAIVLAPDGKSLFLTNGNGPPGSTGRLLRSQDAGLTWSEIILPGTLNSTVWCVASHPSDPGLLFCCSNLGQVFRSTDGGNEWTRLPREFGEVRALHWRPAADRSNDTQPAQWTYK